MSATNYSNDVAAASAMQVNQQFLTGRSMGDDQLSKYKQYFGSPTNVDQRYRYGEDIVSTHDDIYKIYEGQNLYLSDTIVGFTLEKSEWYTSVVPWLETDEMHITFNVFEFNGTLASPVPNEGIPRLISTSSHKFMDSVTRMGIAFIMEGDMVGTGPGDVIYRRNIAGISRVCQKTVNYHTLVKLLVCKDYQKARQDLHREAGKTQQQIEEMECAHFACLAVDRESFTQIIELHRSFMRMEPIDGEADTLILFPGFPWYHDFIQQGTYTEYWQTGPQGRQFLTEGPVAPGSFKGIPVFETDQFNAYNNDMPIQPLVRRKTVGEFYPITFGVYRDKPFQGRYNSDWRSVYIYDFDTDKYVKIKFSEMFKRSNMFGGGEDMNDLNPAVLTLMHEINASYDHNGGFDEEKAIYSNPATLENLEGTSGSERKIYMHLAHNVVKGCVEPVKKFSQFDVDVITTADFRQSAQTVVSAMFPSGTDDISASLDESFAFVQSLEEQPYNEDFAKALGAENINASVASDKTFVGYQATPTDPIDWFGNTYSGLDLPVRDAARPLWPSQCCGLSNYPMIQTLAVQGAERGYEAPVVSKAKRVVAVVKKIAKESSRIMPHSDVSSSSNAQRHFNVPSNEIAIFNYLFVPRPPIFLGIGAGADAGNSNVAELKQRGIVRRDGVPDAVVWKAGNPPGKGALFSDALPRLRLLNVLLSMDRDNVPEKDTPERQAPVKRAATQAGAESDLDKYLARLLNDVDDINESENAREMLIDALFALLNTHKGKPEYAGYAQDSVQKFIAEEIAPAATDVSVLASAAQVTEFVDKLGAITNGAPKEWSAKLKAVKAVDDADGSAVKELAEFGEWFFELELGTGIPVKITDGKPSAFEFGAMQAVAAALRSPIKSKGRKSKSNTKLSILSTFSDKVETLGRQIGRAAGIPFDLGRYAEWVEAVYTSGAVGEDAIDRVSTAFGDYAALSEDIEATAKHAYAAFLDSPAGAELFDAEQSAAGAASMPIGDAVPSNKKAGDARPKVWFRAPLAMSASLLRSLASRTVKPYMIPADPRTNYRTPYSPWAQADGAGPRVTLADFEVVSADASLNRLSNGMIDAGANLGDGSAKPLANEPFVQALKLHDKVDPRQWGQADFRFDVDNAHGGAADVHIPLRRMRNSQYVVDEDLAAQRMEQDNIERLAQGLETRKWGKAFQRAQAAAVDMGRMDRINREKASAIRGLQSVTAQARMEPITAEQARFDPLLQAQLNEQSMQKSAARMHPRMRSQGKWRGDEGNRHNQSAIFKNTRDLPDPADPQYAYEQYHHHRGDSYEYYGPYSQPQVQPRGYYDYGMMGDRPFRHGHGFPHRRGEAPWSARRALDRNAEDYYGNHPNDPAFYGDGYGRHYDNGHGYGHPHHGHGHGHGHHVHYDEEEEDYHQEVRQGEETEEYVDAMHPNSVYRYEKLQEITSPLERLAVQAIYETPNQYSAWLSMIKNNIHVPINLILWRLHIELEMFTCILMQSGIETGANVIGNTNMIFSNTSADKMMHGHFTYHHATMIFNEKYVRHINDVYPMGYIGGWNRRFVMSTDELYKDARGSMIVTAIPITKNNFDFRLDFTDTTVPRHLPSITNRTKGVTTLPGTSSARYYELIWGIGARRKDHKGMTNRYHLENLPINTRASEGKHFTYAPKDGYFSKVEKGKGHLSENRTGPGVRGVFIGTKIKMLPEQHDENQVLD